MLQLQRKKCHNINLVSPSHIVPQNEISKDTYINIMAQYYPSHKSYNYKELSRRISTKEYQEAVKCAKSFGLNNIRSN